MSISSSKLVSSSTSLNADHRRRSSLSSSSSKSSSALSQLPDHYQQLPDPTTTDCCDTDDLNLTSMTVDGLLKTAYADGHNETPESTLLTAEITVLDAACSIAAIDASMAIEDPPPSMTERKTVDDVWREIVAGKREQKKGCKMEIKDEEMMTLEDFLAKAGAVDEMEVKTSTSLPLLQQPQSQRLSGGGVFAMDIPATGQYIETPQGVVEGGAVGFGNGVEVIGGRGKRIAVFEQLDKAAAQRQKRMIKNRESAARSRERKQAYQVELESLALKLEEENMQLLKEKALRSKERYKQLLQEVVPVEEKRRPIRVLRRVQSMQW